MTVLDPVVAQLAGILIEAAKSQNALDARIAQLERTIRELTVERNHLLAQLDRVDDDD